jgi:hypothetical protein
MHVKRPTNACKERGWRRVAGSSIGVVGIRRRIKSYETMTEQIDCKWKSARSIRFTVSSRVTPARAFLAFKAHVSPCN